MIVLAVFEPFLQAAISYEGAVEVVDSRDKPAAIGSNRRLDVGTYEDNGLDGIQAIQVSPTFQSYITKIGFFSQPDFQATAAIWRGFSNDSLQESRLASFACPTGNCTWPAYASLGVCSSCNDISKRITSQRGRGSSSYYFADGSRGNIPVVTIPYYSNVIVGPRLVDYLRYDIPELQLSLSNNLGNFTVGANSGLDLDATLVVQTTPDPGLTLSFQQLKTLVISFSYLRADDSFRDGSTNWEDTKVTAGECALYFCTKLIQSEVVQGTLHETVLGEWTNRTKYSFGAGAPNRFSSNAGSSAPDAFEHYEQYNALSNYTLYFPSDWYRTDLQLFIPEEEYRRIPNMPKVDRQNLQVNISQATIATTIRWFYSEFTRRRETGSFYNQLVYPIFGYNDTRQPQSILGLGVSRNITGTFENVAATMSKWIRDVSFQKDPTIGLTEQYVVRIRIRLAFLSLPLLTIICGCIFSIMSIWSSRQHGMPPWKVSSLATLTYGLDDGSRSNLRQAAAAGYLEAEAKQMVVRMEPSPVGPELKLVRRIVR
jgi:hypothetical protein